MKLGPKLFNFKKAQPIWSEPILTYDEAKMDDLFNEIRGFEDGQTLMTPRRPSGISLETELYLILNS